jgi:hypothetical protein
MYCYTDSDAREARSLAQNDSVYGARRDFCIMFFLTFTLKKNDPHGGQQVHTE